MNFSDSGFQELCKKTELSNNKSNISIQDADESIEKEVETYMELSDVIELSSDSEDEDSTYYMTTVWDISDIETRSPSVITSSPPYNGEVSGMASDNIEILEENNNDPNNNLDFNEIPQESNGNRNIDEISKDRMDYSRELRSPIPGCSKDIDNVENSTENSIYHKLYKDATSISTLLPDIEFGLILETLNKNQYAKNYCELSLWDLLPDKRPMPQVLSKRKLTEDICEVEHKRYMSKEYDIVPNEVQTNIEMTKALCTVSSKEKENLIIKEPINSKIEEKEMINDAESKSISSISHSSIIRPAKLIVPKCVPPLQSQFIPSTNNVILAPAKLTYVSKYETKVTSNDKSLSPLKNLIPTQSTSKINDNISQTNFFPDIKETQNCLLSESETCLKSFKNTNEVNADNSSDQDTSSVISSIVKDAIKGEDSKVLIYSPDISEQSTEFVPSSDNDLNVPSTSNGITISRCGNIDRSTLNKLQEKSLNVLTIADITHEASNVELTKMEESSFNESFSVTGMQNITIKDSKLSPEMTKIYYKLLSMFPGVNSDYIKSICTSNDSQETNLDECILLHELIEHLLVSGDKHPRVNIELEINEAICDVNEQYENMLGIFPDADPIYLRDIVKSIYDKPEELKAFVQSKLETRDYPTREQYLEKRKITEQQKQYTTDFRIDKFLEIFPCPFTHFRDPKRQCSFNTIAFEFLKFYYNKLKVCFNYIK